MQLPHGEAWESAAHEEPAAHEAGSTEIFASNKRMDINRSKEAMVRVH